MSWRAAFGALAPAGPRARLSTLIFHRVLPQPDPLFPHEVDAARFDAVCGWVARWFTVLPLAEALARLADGSLPARAMAITFDDGYADNQTVAAPILQRHGLSATFFVATGYLDGGRMWNDTLIETIRRCASDSLDLSSLAEDERFAALAAMGAIRLGGLDDWSTRRAVVDRLLPQVKYLEPVERQVFVDTLAWLADVDLPDDLMMRSEQVRGLHAAGMGIGAHTVTHPILTRLSDDAARREMHDSKATLEGLLQAPVTLFAYPNGKPGEDYDGRHTEMARDCGFAAAMSTRWGVASRETDRYQLPRFTPWDRARWRFAAHLAANLRQC